MKLNKLLGITTVAFILSFFSATPMLAQETDAAKYNARKFNSRIIIKSADKGNDSKHYFSTIGGSITATGDSTITIRISDWTGSTVNTSYRTRKYDLRDIPVSHIDHIKIRRKGRVAGGMALGLLSGALIGALIAPEPDCGRNELFCGVDEIFTSGLIMAGIGFGIGTAIGSTSFYIPIMGKQARYEKEKERLKLFME